MARRRKRSKAGRLSLGTLIVLLASLFLASRKGWPALAICWIFTLVPWVAFFKRTQCDVETTTGQGCGNTALWVPIIHPCWSGSMSVLVEGAAEPVSSADIEVRDPRRIGDRFG